MKLRPVLRAARPVPGRGRRAPRWLLGALLLCASGAWALGPVGREVLLIEAELGDQSEAVLKALAPLESAARQAGGDDLRTFLAAWGYAHGTLDHLSIADAAVVELGQLAEKLPPGPSRQAARASAYTLQACLVQFAGQLNAAYGWVSTALPLLDEHSEPALRYWVTMTAADIGALVGQVDESIRHLRAALQAAREEGNDRRMAQARLGLAPLLLVRGEHAAALVEAEAALGQARAAGAEALMVSAYVAESLAARHAGQTARAQRAAARAQALSMELTAKAASAPKGAELNPQAGGPVWLDSQTSAMLHLSGLQLSAHQYGPARELAAEALRLSAQQPEPRALAQINLGMALLGLGQRQAGLQLADEGLAQLRQLDRKYLLLLQLNRYSTLLDRHGEPALAVQHLREALLLENALVRRDRLSTVVALQQQSSQAQQQRELDALKHENTVQALALARGQSENRLTLLLVLALAGGVALSLGLLARVRRANAQLAAHNLELEHVSTHDRVTGLPNRRALEGEADRLAGEHFHGIALSIKRFGLILATLGHSHGDKLLQLIAKRLDALVQAEGGTLYRLDGLSFGILVSTARLRCPVEELLERLARTLDEPFAMGGQQLQVFVSIGAARYPQDGRNIQEVARCIEMANAEARRLPGNSYVRFTDTLLQAHQHRAELEAQLAGALERREFQLHYQAQYTLRGRRLLGFEALLRWQHKGRSISPAVFIPLAEESGLIIAIGRWVLEQACQQARSWTEAGLGQVRVAVNISPRQFQHPGFTAMVAEVLERSGVAPAQIELEITESVVMDEADSTVAELSALRDMGLQLAIDDFGTGFASLIYLRRFPLHRLKIDQSFIRGSEDSGKDAAIVQSMIQLGHSLGLEVVAEGVETESQQERLLRWGCDIAQGYLLARPQAADAATALLREALQSPSSQWLDDPVI